MKFNHLLALSFLSIATQSMHASDTVLAAVVAHDHASTQNSQANPQNLKAEIKSNELSVTNAIVELGIPLNPGLNYPAPGLKMELYTKVDGHITVETEIIVEGEEPPHPLVAKLLAIIGYEPENCGYFWCTEPTASKTDAGTKLVSIKRPFSYSAEYGHEVHVKLRTLLDDQQICKYIANLNARRNAK